MACSCSATCLLFLYLSGYGHQLASSNAAHDTSQEVSYLDCSTDGQNGNASLLQQTLPTAHRHSIPLASASPHINTLKVMEDKQPEGESPRSPKCANLRQFRFQQDGRVLAWYNDDEPKELYPAWSTISGANWELRPEVVTLLNEFLALQDKTFCRTTNTTNQHVFVISRMNGLGNAIFGTLTYMMAAMLMEPPRAVVLRNWDTSFDDAFNTPLMEYTFEKLREADVLTQEVVDSPSCPGHPDVRCFGNSAADAWMWCGSFDDVFTTRITHIDGCCGNFIPLFYRNVRYGPTLRKIFGEQELAVPLLRTLFRPSQRVLPNVSARWTNHRPYIAAAVRVFHDESAEHVYEAFSFCLKHLLGKPEYQNASIYVAAGNSVLVNSLKERIGDAGAGVWSHPPPEGEGFGALDSVMMVRDMWTVAQADAFVLTPWSSASQLGGSWGNTVPWELEGNDFAITGKCHRVLSNEPCTQRAWGGNPDQCPEGMTKIQPLKYPATLDRRCGSDNEIPATRQAVQWVGLSVEE